MSHFAIKQKLNTILKINHTSINFFKKKEKKRKLHARKVSEEAQRKPIVPKEMPLHSPSHLGSNLFRGILCLRKIIREKSLDLKHHHPSAPARSPCPLKLFPLIFMPLEQGNT